VMTSTLSCGVVIIILMFQIRVLLHSANESNQTRPCIDWQLRPKHHKFLKRCIIFQDRNTSSSTSVICFLFFFFGVNNLRVSAF
jgi:hypothetical protein